MGGGLLRMWGGGRRLQVQGPPTIWYSLATGHARWFSGVGCSVNVLANILIMYTYVYMYMYVYIHTIIYTHTHTHTHIQKQVEEVRLTALQIVFTRNVSWSCYDFSFKKEFCS